MDFKQGRSQGGGAKGARAPPLAKRYVEGGTGKKYFRETKIYFSAGAHPLTSRALPLKNSWLRAWFIAILFLLFNLKKSLRHQMMIHLVQLYRHRDYVRSVKIIYLLV